VTCTRQVLHDIALGKGDKEDGKEKSNKGKKKVILKECFSLTLFLCTWQVHSDDEEDRKGDSGDGKKRDDGNGKKGDDEDKSD
jgi:hypothetical protein